MNGMKVTIAKVHDNLFSGDATSITVPTTAGELTILPNHQALVGTIKAGIVTVRLPAQSGAPGGEHKFEVESGVLEVSNGQVTVLL